jgi:hypothetical protein
MASSLSAEPRDDLRSSNAFVLVAVLVFVMLMAMIATSLLFRFKAEDTAASASSSTEQAWAAALSGVQEALRVAAAAKPGFTDWQDNPRAFRDRLVFDDGSDRWHFTIYSPAASDSLEELHYGLSGEAGKVNLNHDEGLDPSKLPRVTPLMLQSLHSFITGATAPAILTTDETISTETPGRTTPAHGPLATLDELMLVPGFPPSLVYGEDANLNGHLDPNENDSDERAPSDNNDGRLDRGLRQYFTVGSYDLNRDREGRPRLNLNESLEALSATDLPPTLTNYLAAVRAAKLQIAHPADLLEATTKIKGADGQEIEVASGIGKEELALVLDRFTTSTGATEPGLIDVNTASIAVLTTLPGVDEALAEAIVSTRNSISPERRATTAWLYQEGVLDADRFKRLAPHLTSRSLQFSFYVLGYGVPSGRYRVLEATIDVADPTPRVTYLRDLSRLGLPFKVEPERTGTPGAQIPRPGADVVKRLSTKRPTHG